MHKKVGFFFILILMNQLELVCVVAVASQIFQQHTSKPFGFPEEFDSTHGCRTDLNFGFGCPNKQLEAGFGNWCCRCRRRAKRFQSGMHCSSLTASQCSPLSEIQIPGLVTLCAVGKRFIAHFVQQGHTCAPQIYSWGSVFVALF